MNITNMAPANGASKVMQNRPRPAVAVPRGIVPALPLSYGKLQQKKLPTREKAKEVVPPSSTVPAVQEPITSISAIDTPSAHIDEPLPKDKALEATNESPKFAPAAAAGTPSTSESLDGFSSTECGVTNGSGSTERSSTEREGDENLVNVNEAKGEI